MGEEEGEGVWVVDAGLDSSRIYVKSRLGSEIDDSVERCEETYGF